MTPEQIAAMDGWDIWLLVGCFAFCVIIMVGLGLLYWIFGVPNGPWRSWPRWPNEPGDEPPVEPNDAYAASFQREWERHQEELQRLRRGAPEPDYRAINNIRRARTLSEFDEANRDWRDHG